MKGLSELRIEMIKSHDEKLKETGEKNRDAEIVAGSRDSDIEILAL